MFSQPASGRRQRASDLPLPTERLGSRSGRACGARDYKRRNNRIRRPARRCRGGLPRDAAQVPACGGSWSFFTWRCGRRSRTLRLLDSKIMCRHCCIARGVRYRCEPMEPRQRAEHRIAKLRAKLESAEPLRLKPLRYLKMERRTHLEEALQRNLLVRKKRDLAKLCESDRQAEGMTDEATSRVQVEGSGEFSQHGSRPGEACAVQA
jgi:hypothetical protein